MTNSSSIGNLSIDFDLPLLRTISCELENPENVTRAGIRLFVDPTLGLLRSSVSKHTEAILLRDYEAGSLLGVPMGDLGIGESYLNEYLQKIFALDPSRVLEVAAGNGRAAEALSQRGISTIGIDPNLKSTPSSKQTAILTLVRGFFPQQMPQDQLQFDLVCSHAFLEHVDDPVSMLQEMARWCQPGGSILTAVPDCSESIRRGDCSMLIHEHRSYFTPQSLFNCAIRAGLTAIQVTQSEYGGVLYMVAKSPTDESSKDASVTGEVRKDEFSGVWSSEQLLLSFALNRNRVSQRIAEFDRGGGLRLIYVPHRLINYIEGIIDSIPIDDAMFCQGATVVGFRHQVRSLDQIGSRPEAILLGSHTFEHALRDRIQRRWDGVRIVALRELLES
jgi:2-polyprenyl-3-methyl-5-hydroxy-6-metoxy-1,4-benzoquinol methylase